MAQKARLRQLIAMGLGLGPGLLLPFVLALVLDKTDSDRIIVLMSVSVLGTAIITQAAEAFAVAEISRFITAGDTLRRALGRSARSLLIPSAIGVCAVTIITLGAFIITGGLASEDGWWMIMIALAVFISCLVSPLSASLILDGKSYIPLATQGLRYATLIVGVLILPYHGGGLVTFFLLGDLLRAVILYAAQHRALATPNNNLEAGATVVASHEEKNATNGQQPAGSLYQQFGSNGITQASVLLERAVIASSTPGSITYYELADKIAYIVIQAGYALGILPRLSNWAQATGAGDLETGHKQYVSDMKRLLRIVAIVALPTATLAAILSTTGIVQGGIRDVAAYSAVLLVAALPIVYVFGAMRFLVMLEGQRYFVPVAIISISIMATVGLGLFHLIGVVGILLGRLLSRLVTAIMYRRAITTLVRRQALT